MFKIYKLVHAGKIVYIGCTTQELKRRKSNGYRSNEAVNSIRKECEIELIEETDMRDDKEEDEKVSPEEGSEAVVARE